MGYAQSDSVGQSFDTSAVLVLTPQDTTSNGSIEVLDKDTKEKFNRRYQVGGAIAVMIFVGILIGSVSTFNPD